jgi:signal transduction histidine kinase
MRPLTGLGAPFALATPALSLAVADDHRLAALWAPAILAFYLAGLWAAGRRPASPAARLLLLTGVVAVAWYCAGMAELLWHGAALNALVLALDVALPACVMVLLATYPGGELTRGARWALWVAGALAAALVVGTATGGPVPSYVLAWNEGQTSSGLLGGLHDAALALFPLAGALLLAARYRPATTGERVSIRWLALAGLLLAVDGVFSGFPSLDVVPAFLSIPLIALFPVLAAIGIVNPALLDVDEALRRSALFAALWAGASLAYLAVASALGAAAGSGGVAAAVPVTIAATLAFHPVWQTLLRRAGRRLFGGGLDGDELLLRLGHALEHTLEPGPLAHALAGTIREGLGVRWVRIALDGEPVALAGRDGGEPVAAVTELIHDGVALGRIECGLRTHGVLRGEDHARLRTLGRQVALAATNARLATELSERVEEIRAQAAALAASRERIVEAEEAGRRRLERDIHDGIQQELVALIARIGLAQAQLGRDPSLVVETLADLRSEAGQALADLRELAGGIHPSVLGDRGIVDAIEARASRLAVGVTITCDAELRETRFPQTVEGAAYFAVCEAFSNALKHSGAERVIVRLRHDDEQLEVEISDDGAGFDVARATGSGLAGLADRIDALRGRFTVESRPGAGTTLRVTLPVAAGALHA